MRIVSVKWCLIAIVLIAVSTNQQVATSRAADIPGPGSFGLPFSAPPGPSTWYIGQQYGNTSGAYNFGTYWYGAGQGLHFGIDFSAPCATPVVAVADGVVDFVDNFSRGSLPHNLAIRHAAEGVISFYGHLYRRPGVARGQPVKRGEVVALSGDPDSTCISRPHLHLEIRSLDYGTALNPADYIQADWVALGLIGYQGRYAKDLYHPNRWQTFDDQPSIEFGEKILNKYRAAWPPALKVSPAPQTAAAFSAPPLSESAPVMRRLTEPECCSLAWWAPGGQSIRFWNGPEDQMAVTNEMLISNGTPHTIADSTPASVSLDGRYALQWVGDRPQVVRLADGQIWPLSTSGAWPVFSPGATRLLWQRFPGDPVPGNAPPLTEVWISKVDGTDRQIITIQPGGSVHWLDDDRVLLARREGRTLRTTLSIYRISDKSITPLFSADNLRGISVAPGGAQIVYYLTFQKAATDDGMYILDTKGGAKPAKLPFFGSWRWRDSTNLLYIPYQPGEPSMTLMLYNIAAGTTRVLTDPAKQPFKILNDDWSVAPDGRNIAYWDAGDRAIWLVTLS